MNYRRILLLVAFLTLFAGMGGAVHSGHGVIHYRLNQSSCGGAGSVTDFSGANNDGDCNAATVPGFGQENSTGNWDTGIGYNFTEGDAEVDQPSLDLSQNYTITAWVWFDSVNDGDMDGVFDFRDIEDIYVREESGSLKFVQDATTVASTSVSSNQWYFIALRWNSASDTAEAFKYTSSIGTASLTGTGTSGGTSVLGSVAGSQDLDGAVDEFRVWKKPLNSSQLENLFNKNCPGFGDCPDLNSPPAFDSTDHDPDNPVMGDSVTVQANTSDADGDDVQAWANISYGNGTPITGITPMDEPTANDFEIIDAFTANTNATYFMNFTAGDGTANSTDSLSFTLTDGKPVVSILKPDKEEFSYNFSWKFRIKDDGDDDLGENVTCSKFNDTVPFSGDVFALENASQSERTFSGTLRHDVGSGTFTTQCSDGTNTVNDSRSFEVFDVKTWNVSSPARVFETETIDFSVGVRVGDMVQNLTSTLVWNNTTSTTTRRSFSSIVNATLESQKDIPLVDTNDTKVSWYRNITVNRTDFSTDTFETAAEDTSNRSQNIFHAYSLLSSQLDPSNYTEDVTYNHLMNFTYRTAKATLNGNDFYHRTKSLTTATSTAANIGEFITYKGSQNAGNVTDSFERFNVSGNLTVSFDGDTRVIDVPNSTLTVNKVLLTDCGSGTASQTVGLRFNTFQETDRDNKVRSDISMSVQIWDHEDFKRTYNFSSTNKTTHEFCIFPADAEYVIDSTKKLIQYGDSSFQGDDFVSRSYFLINETMNNDTITVPLYLLNNSDATQVNYDIVNEDNEPVSGAVIKVERFFEAVDKHIVVAMMKTGSEGSSRTQLEKGGEIYYQHKFYTGRQLVDEAADQLVPEDNDFRFEIGADTQPSYFEFTNNIGHNCIEATTYINCSYSSSTERLESVNLKTERVDAVGRTTVCDLSASTSSGELACTGLNASNTTYDWSFSAEMSDGSIVILVSELLSEAVDRIEDMGLFVSFATFVTAAMAGLFLPEAVVLLGTLAIIVVSMSGLLAVPIEAVISLTFVSAVLVWRMMQ